jgi:hypothetical protein
VYVVRTFRKVGAIDIGDAAARFRARHSSV